MGQIFKMSLCMLATPPPPTAASVMRALVQSAGGAPCRASGRLVRNVREGALAVRVTESHGKSSLVLF